MNKPVIMAYARNPALSMITREDALRLSHINLAFGLLRNGKLTMRMLPSIGRIKQIREWNPEIKIVLSIGGWGAGGFSTMARTREGREAFVQSVRRQLDKHALDGVDIDWEYPCNNAAGIDSDPSDKENFTALLQELKDVVAPKTVSIAAGAIESFIRDTQMERVGEICDYVQLMTYDLCAGPHRRTVHHTPLAPSPDFPQAGSVKSAVELFLRAGVPREKLVIGAAFYSRKWDDISADNNGLFQPTQADAGFGPDYTTLVADYIGKNGWTRHWDDAAKAPWLYKDGTFLTYDDAESICLKCEYVKAENLYGIMYWEHSADRTHTLLKTIADCLWG